MNLWACATKATLQLVKMHTISVTLCLWKSLQFLNEFQSIHHKMFTHTIHSIYSQESTSFFQKPLDSKYSPTSPEKAFCWDQKENLSTILDVIS